jgi:beta-lactamase regulating signal transducer with metallopeptidase domain
VETAFHVRAASTLWLAGCLALGLKLLAAAFFLRRRLSACRIVTDFALLDLLETIHRQLGLRRAPALLVTPECVSPSLVGSWRPRIVLPESMLTEASSSRLRHVLAHELAHMVRGDSWTNWLMLAARTLHWFNPVAWWTVRAMQAEREAACDELVFAALGEHDRSEYAATIVELAASLTPLAIAPGLIGLFAPTCGIKARVERLLRSPSVKVLRAPVAAGLLLGLALMGLTDAMPGVQAQAPKDNTAPTARETPPAKDYVISGRCLNHDDGTALAGATVRLYRADGRTGPPVEIARTITDANGQYTFTELDPPRLESDFDRLSYAVLGFAPDRPIGVSFHFFRNDREVVEIRIARESSKLSGRVIDAAGRPVAGAMVMTYGIDGRPIPGLFSATTDAAGRFTLANLAVYQRREDPTAVPIKYIVRHPDHPETSGVAPALPADVVVALPDGCAVTGSVTDRTTGRPAAGAVITARRTDEWGESFASSDAAGRFRLVVPEGRYDILVEAKDRVCIAVTDRECQAGERVELPRFTLLGGGFISGQVINTATREVVTVTDRGAPIMLGLIGPSQPAGRAISPVRMAAVDKAGRFTLRAAPGENFPYFVNTTGDRMAWDTRQKPPVLVTDGKTTTYNMLITPEVTPEERLRAAHKLVGALPKGPSERTARILGEFRKLGHTVNETELWCLLMRELWAIGRDAVPQLCAELDRTTEDRTLRRLGFALRAIDDPRAVPALIRALPKTLVPSSSDYGLIVGDHELIEFMQAHDLGQGQGGTYFDLGRPVREIVGALHRLTGQDFEDADLFTMRLSVDPRRQVLERRIYARQAQRWQTWWEAHARKLTTDPAYHKVNLIVHEEPLPPVKPLGKGARLIGEWQDAVVSPAAEANAYAWNALDLDTGYRPRWPATLPRDESPRHAKPLAQWASQNGIDLMCVTHRLPDGTETYVLRAIGMKVREITPRELRNLEKLIAGGTVPEGRPVDELLMHYDSTSQTLVPDTNGVFLFVTREGNMGVIETTDRVTRTPGVGGAAAGGAPRGVGFHRGVRFNLKAIVP